MISEFTGENAFLSNFYPAKFIYNGIEFKTTEHFYQAMKTLEPGKFYEIINAETPMQAKKLGGKVKVRPDWDDVKVKVMKKALEFKFNIPDLRMKLLMTGEEELIEGNYWHDNIWGICNCAECDNNGQNLLGKLLMECRAEIRKELEEKANETSKMAYF